MRNKEWIEVELKTAQKWAQQLEDSRAFWARRVEELTAELAALSKFSRENVRPGDVVRTEKGLEQVRLVCPNWWDTGGLYIRTYDEIKKLYREVPVCS